MNYYIDFDNTLFDTVSFYRDMKNIFYQNGLTQVMIDEYKKDLVIPYDPLEMLNYYQRLNKIDKKINIEIDNLFKKANNYLYNDSIDFLLRIKNKGYKIIILTYGSENYQMLKINYSKLRDYVDEIIITDISKDLLEIDYQNGVFIDDNPDNLKDLNDKKPFALIRIKRSNNKYSKVDLSSLNIEEYDNLKSIIIWL